MHLHDGVLLASNAATILKGEISIANADLVLVKDSAEPGSLEQPLKRAFGDWTTRGAYDAQISEAFGRLLTVTVNLRLNSHRSPCRSPGL